MKNKANRMEKWADGMVAVGIACAFLMCVCWMISCCTLHVGHPAENGLSVAMLYAGAVCFVVALLLCTAADGVHERAWELERKARRERL